MGFNRIYVKIFFVILSVVCASTIFFIIRKHMDKNVTTNYSWEPRLCTPRNFSIQSDWFYVTYGSDMAASVMKDIFFNGMAVDDCHEQLEEGIKGMSPTGVDITWFSHMERKCYRADIRFLSKEMEMIDNLMRKGYNGINYDDNDERILAKRQSYDRFYVCCFPGGKLRFFLGDKSFRTIELGLSYQAEETHELDESILNGTRNMFFNPDKYWENINEYYDSYLYEGSHSEDLDSIKVQFGDKTYERIKHHREKGVQLNLWDKYFKRYDYSIIVEFEDTSSVMDLKNCHFTNAEMFMHDPNINPANTISTPSPIRMMNCRWKNASNYYKCFIYFNEEETFDLFDRAFSENSNASASLRVLVSKYNNLLEVSLDVDGKSYRFEHAQIDILRNSITMSEDWEYVYENYEGSQHQEFEGV